jgi:hypothetical protein
MFILQQYRLNYLFQFYFEDCLVAALCISYLHKKAEGTGTAVFEFFCSLRADLSLLHIFLHLQCFKSTLYCIMCSVVHPKLFFPDPDPTLTLISDPDSNPDPACL